jgi:hypothetical protein
MNFAAYPFFWVFWREGRNLAHDCWLTMRLAEESTICPHFHRLGLLIYWMPAPIRAGSMEAVIAGKRNAGQSEGIYH